MIDLIGKRLGQYEIIEVLGKGGMATVYRARRISILTPVAIKVIKPELSEIIGERFEREFLHQRSGDRRAIVDTLDLGWRVASLLPASDLADLPPDLRARCKP